ncbi:single-strand binding protein family protein [Yersinia pekkanenii]|uniref:Single-strand binding protein family protein n=2 Tax=Yersinia pekkanenii TaxID=1288385 RepID=A0A0T9RGQ5_9GAMM|nr:hypothetical protein [Yersinia pekkanenii]CNI62199.1 single-strand binding protein family protein [Yersinia pekkanenii]
MQSNTITGRLLKPVSLIKKDDVTYCRLTVAESKKRNNVSTVIEFAAYDELALRAERQLDIGDLIVVHFIVKNSQYEKDGVNYHGYSFTAESFEYLAAGKAKQTRSQSMAHQQ